MNQNEKENGESRASSQAEKEVFMIKSFLPVLAISRWEAAQLISKMQDVLGFLLKIGNGTDKAALVRRLIVWLIDATDEEDYCKWLESEEEALSFIGENC